MQSTRTDLAMETAAGLEQERNGIEVTEENIEDILVTRVRIYNEAGAQSIGKPIGNYITIETEELLNNNMYAKELVSRVLSEEITRLKPAGEYETLVVGLGNRFVTSDSLGPRVMDKLLVTRHLLQTMPQEVDDRICSVSALSPGVLGITGIETGEIIEGVIAMTKPGLVVTVDALAARSIKRICTTIQIADTGIQPGSGVGNNRRHIDEKTLGVPVLAIGVPMVVYASTIVWDTISSLFWDNDNNERTYDNKVLDREAIDHITQLLAHQESTLVVTPKDVDAYVQGAAQAIADGLNLSLHAGVLLDEFRMINP